MYKLKNALVCDDIADISSAGVYHRQSMKLCPTKNSLSQI